MEQSRQGPSSDGAPSSGGQQTPEDVGQRDAQWVAEALAGDQAAFGRLVSAYERRAVGTAYRLLGNSHDAMEVAQDAFLRAYRSLGKLKEPNRFGPWLLRIVSNLSLNVRRSRKTGSTVTLDEQWGTDGATTSEGKSVISTVQPDREAQGHEMSEVIQAALDKLPDKQRLALVLFTMEGWAQKDIAELLDCSLENVKWHVFQARKRLRELLGDLLQE
jgi:RNA polymerase sigma-70 factor (ECF subfamily)